MKIGNLILVIFFLQAAKQVKSDNEGHNTDWYNSVDDIYSDPLDYDKQRYEEMKKYKEMKTVLVTSKPATKPAKNCMDQCAARCGKPVKKVRNFLNFKFVIKYFLT